MSFFLKEFDILGNTLIPLELEEMTDNTLMSVGYKWSYSQQVAASQVRWKTRHKGKQLGRLSKANKLPTSGSKMNILSCLFNAYKTI